MDRRKHMGEEKRGLIIPVTPSLSEMDETYFRFIEDIKNEVKNRRITAVVSANSNMICMHWYIGTTNISLLDKRSVYGYHMRLILGFMSYIDFINASIYNLSNHDSVNLD